MTQIVTNTFLLLQGAGGAGTIQCGRCSSSCALFHAPAHTPVALMTSQAASSMLIAGSNHSLAMAQWAQFERATKNSGGGPGDATTDHLYRATAASVNTPLYVKCTVFMQLNTTLSTDTSRI